MADALEAAAADRPSQALVDQIEFYFSDANLRRDRFLSQELRKDGEGYVDVSVLSTFNKIKAMNVTENAVKAAIEALPHLLSLSPDRARVRRVNPVPEEKNVDLATVYVEGLPLFADQSFIKRIFSRFGKVDYVSLPKGRQAKANNKGFCFVEFSAPDAANACVSHFSTHVDLRAVSETAATSWRGVVPKDAEAVTQSAREEMRVRTKEMKKHAQAHGHDHVAAQAAEDEMEEALTHLRVISKASWESLKATYKSLQKQQLHEYKLQQREQASEAAADVPIASAKGVLVLLSQLSDECASKAAIRESLLPYNPDIAYIDYAIGATTATVRFMTPESASSVLAAILEAQKTGARLPVPFIPSLLQGEEEDRYWKKIQEDRETRRSRKQQQQHKHKPGRERVLEKQERLMDGGAMQKVEKRTKKGEKRSDPSGAAPAPSFVEDSEPKTKKKKKSRGVKRDHKFFGEDEEDEEEKEEARGGGDDKEAGADAIAVGASETSAKDETLKRKREDDDGGAVGGEGLAIPSKVETKRKRDGGEVDES